MRSEDVEDSLLKKLRFSSGNFLKCLKRKIEANTATLKIR